MTIDNQNKNQNIANKVEKAIAIAVVNKGADKEKTLDFLNELEELAETAGAIVLEKIYQELAKPNSSTAIGAGKVEEVKEIIKELEIDIVIFDDDLTPVQIKNLEKAWNIKVIDRSGLILDIFAKHARTLEAKTQVELAQLQYLLPRLTRMWTHLSKQFGGIGSSAKGPGETQIESDRRLIKIKISKLKEDLVNIENHKIQQKKNRTNLPKFAIVGYTNAGKSTLMNVIAETELYTEDKLFATLDTTTRAFHLPSSQRAVISDTVGFIRKLPHHLVASFRSTLMEASDADVILHVADVSHKTYKDQITIVNETLKSLNILDKPIILVLNKVDKITDKDYLHYLKSEHPDSILISAKKVHNITALLDTMQSKYESNIKKVQVILPYDKMDLISHIFELSEIIEKEDLDYGQRLYIKINKGKEEIFTNIFKEFLIN